LEYQITPDSEDGQTPSTKSQTNSKLNPNSNTEANSKVLGVVKKFGLDEKPAVVSVYNQLVHFAAGLVKYWRWTLGGIIILVLALRLTGGRKRRR
ncbi:MAG: hypothetical protein Q8O98_02130, partial [bacterium]|nr:hypothetical protein [bacterium]